MKRTFFKNVGLPKFVKSKHKPIDNSGTSRCDRGLILLQIDGLSRLQLEHAIESGRMPFLKQLQKTHGYRLWSLYSGLPSSTPAFQGEVFYGVKGSVPGFGFRNHTTGDMCHMFSARSAAPVQLKLAEMNPGLLDGGSAYSNIYTGGAVKAGFCVSRLGSANTLQNTNFFIAAHAFLMHSFTLGRIIALFIIEAVLAIIDVFRGIIAREDFIKELNFIPARVGICVLLREVVTANVIFDTHVGVPVIHCNFLGYDEQSHRRGPSSKFAHWTLKGIDDCIKRIYAAGKQSSKRSYDIWIYSDHGQEKAISYHALFGRTIQDAVEEVLEKFGIADSPDDNSAEGIQLKRIMLLGGSLFQRVFKPSISVPLEGKIRVIAIGPVGHAYFPLPDNLELLHQIGPKLVEHAHVPMVIMAAGGNRAVAWTDQGKFILPDETAAIVGADHPFLKEITRDLVSLANHPDAGTFVLSGFRRNGKVMTFPVENGAHAGPGPEETHAFMLLPGDAPLKARNGKNFRPLDLRQSVLKFLSPKKLHSSV